MEPGNITLSDALSIQPFGNTIDVVTLRGETLRKVFEVSALGGGKFLQVSGEFTIRQREILIGGVKSSIARYLQSTIFS